MPFLDRVLVAAGQLVGLRGSPVGFGALIVVMLGAAFVLNFSETTDRARLVAFLLLVLACCGIVAGLLAPPAALGPDG